MVNLFCVKVDNAPPIGNYYKNGDDMDENAFVEAVREVTDDPT